jgi:hypothetical protein
MLAEMRPSELGEWMAFWQIEPWGDERADLRTAINTAVLANVNRDSKRRPNPFTPKDFMPYYREPEPDPALAQRKALDLEKRLLAMFGLKVDKKKLRKKV